MSFHSNHLETKSFRRGLSLVSALILGISLPLTSVQAAVISNTATATASAVIFAPLTVVVTGSSTLNFGKIAPTGVVGTVTIEPMAGSRSASNVALLPSLPSDLSLLVNGEPNETFILDIPTPNVTLTGAGSSMILDLFTAFPDSISGVSEALPTTHTLNVAGFFPVNVGGTLNVAGDQAAGTYSGTFDVSVTYQ